jgi:hypothetical protein
LRVIHGSLKTSAKKLSNTSVVYIWMRIYGFIVNSIRKDSIEVIF